VCSPFVALHTSHLFLARRFLTVRNKCSQQHFVFWHLNFTVLRAVAKRTWICTCRIFMENPVKQPSWILSNAPWAHKTFSLIQLWFHCMSTVVLLVAIVVATSLLLCAANNFWSPPSSGVSLISVCPSVFINSVTVKLLH
jgi:hypothetical protein